MLARLHEEAQLLAELSDQAATVTWLKDGRELAPGPKYEVQTSDKRRLLLVRDVTRDDAGLYECVSHGIRLAYQLSVQGEADGVAEPRPSWDSMWEGDRWNGWWRVSCTIGGRSSHLIMGGQ